MTHTKLRALVLTLAALLPFCATLGAAEKPLDTFEKREWLGVEWASTLVTYRVEFGAGKVKPGAVRLFDADGEGHPFQLWRVEKHPDGSVRQARLSFFAELEADGAYAFRLVPGTPQPQEEAPSARETDEGIVLENAHLALRLPPAGRQRFDEPRPFSAEDSGDGSGADVPGPLRGVRLLDGTWTPPSYFVAGDPEKAPRFTGYSCEITERGPLFVEARVRYELDDGGFYQCTIRLLRESPAARIDEQADLQHTRKKRDRRVVFPLADGQGFAPDAAWWASNSGRLFESEKEFESEVVEAGFGKLGKRRRKYSSRVFATDESKERILPLAVWYPYASTAQYFGLAERKEVAAAEKPGDIPFVGIVPMHAGNWRGMPEGWNGELIGYQGGRVAMQWPLTVGPHPNTLLHTGEYDPELPYTYLRRQWALFGGPMRYLHALNRFRTYEGYITLDDYKDWVMEWESEGTYPTLVFGPEDVERLRGRLDQHPAAGELKKLLYFNPDPDRRERLWKGLSSSSQWGSPRGQALVALGRAARSWACPWIQGFRHSQRAGWTGKADELLSSKDLSVERRRQLRAWIAAAANALSEPDCNPRGMMSHLGNPNMPINRFFGLTFAAALIPDHPRAEQWLSVSRDYMRYKLAMNTAPNDAWSELISYYMSAANHIMQAGMVLDQSGRLGDHLARLASRAGLFPLYLLSPEDPRFGERAIPGWGHEGYYMIPNQWLPVAGFMRERNRTLAEDMIWAWDELGRPMQGHHDAGFSPYAVYHADLLNELDEDYVPERIGSRWLPGFGATMRAHAGDPNETYLSYRQGYLVSHSDANQGDFVIYSKGAPLTTLSVYQYALHQYDDYKKMYNEFGWYNRVRFGSRDSTGGWPGGGPISQVHRHSTSRSVDYLRGLGDYGPQRWQRQILFLKGKKPAGPNYFVLRDSFRQREGKEGDLQETFWGLGTGGSGDRVQLGENGMNYTSPWGARLDVRFLQPATVDGEVRDADAVGPMYHRAALNWQKAGSPVEKGSGTNIKVPETTTVTSFGPIEAGTDILVALYPQGEGEELPEYEYLAEGVLRAKTSEATDYVFCGGDRMKFSQGPVSFSGISGAVRIYPEEVHLVVAEAPGEVSYRGATLRAEVPTTRIVPKERLEGQRIVVHKPDHDIRFHLDQDNVSSGAMRPGVTRHDFEGGFAYEFSTTDPIEFEHGEAHFSGRRGGIVVDEQRNTVRLIMLDGERLSYGDLKARHTGGPYDVTFHPDHIEARTAGRGRFLYLTRPEGLNKLPTLVVDGQTYAPGTHDNTLIVPLLPGRHDLRIRALEQPPVFRNWQAWGGRNRNEE